MEQVQLNQGVPDSIVWAWEKDGAFSVRSAYAAKFWGRKVIPMADFTWKSKAPLQCHFFAWLALQNRCWTSDRLERRGLDHQEACPFCEQEKETIDHILLNCVFARECWTIVCIGLIKQTRLDPSEPVQLITMVCQQAKYYDMHEGRTGIVAASTLGALET